MFQIYKWKEKRSLTSVTKFNTNLAICFSTSLSAYCCSGAGSGSRCKVRFLLRCWSKWLPSISVRRTIRESTVPMNRTAKRGNTAFWSMLGNAVSSSGGGFMNVLLQIRRKIPDCLTDRNLKKAKLLGAVCHVTQSRDSANYFLLQSVDDWLIDWLIDYFPNCMTECMSN